MKAEISDIVSIQLQRDGAEALYVQLYNELRDLIERGRLTHGYHLPPVRSLARELAVNTGTVVSAYKLLEQNGYIFSRAGSGSYVADVLPTDDAAPEEHPLPEIIAPERYDIDLAGIALNPDLISVDVFKAVINEVLDRDKAFAFTYQDSHGFLPLRRSIAAYMKQNGVNADAGEIQIISGAQQGIDIVAKSLLNYGDYVFTEQPTYPGALAAFRSRGAKIVGIPLLDDGIDIAALEENLRKFRPKLLYVMPNVQNPSGISYSPAKRNRLLGLARYYGALILEDDYISELYYGGQPLAPLKALDRDDRIIYLKSFSKIFIPGLRLAFLTMPRQLTSKLLAVKHNSDIYTSGLTQRVLDLYLRQGLWAGHILAIKKVYHQRFAAAVKALQDSWPAGVTYIVPQGGLSVWCALPTGLSAAKVAAQCLSAGVLISGGQEFFSRPGYDSYFRVSFAKGSLSEVERGIAIVGAVLAKTLKNEH